MSSASEILRARSALLALSVLAFFVLHPKATSAHEFVVALQAVGAERDLILTDALGGFLLATEERDGHANETSNGHLGGLDVYIVPQLANVAARFPELKKAPSDRPDIVAVIGASGDVAAEGVQIDGDGVVLRPGLLHDANGWTATDAQDPESFAARYIARFGQPASQWAVRGYNAARRIDAAVRPLGGVNDRAGLDRAFADSAEGIRWRSDRP